MLLLTAALALLAQAKQPDLRERWVYYPLDLAQERNVAKLEDLLRRAAAAGYNAVALEDPNFAKLPLQKPAYFATLERVKKAAAAHKLDLVPALFQVGHSENLLAQDPNLAEGLPARDALLVVRGGAARLEPDPPVAFREKWDWKDPFIGNDWTVRDPQGRFARIVQKVRVRPFRQYHVSVRVRTRDFQGTPRIITTGRGRLLNYRFLGAKPTQDWTEHHAYFNSMEADEVRVTLGCWDGGAGELAWSAPRIEEVAFVNLLRRDGAPLAVRLENGRTLEEGKDFDPLADPGLVDVACGLPYDSFREPPLLRTSLPDGTRLRASWFHALSMPDHGQTMICPSEPKTMEILRDQARRLHEIFRPRAWLMTHDEIRVLNWDESCRRRNLDAGEIVAENVRACLRVLRDLDAGATVYVWSDVFDPFHNARGDYCLVRGSLEGTWKGLDKDVVLANWYFDRRDESLRWFESLGNRQLIAGYYDQKPERARDWLESSKSVRGVIGIMYTSWYDRYEDLETWANHVQPYR